MLVVIQEKQSDVSVVFEWEDCCHIQLCFQEESKIYLNLPRIPTVEEVKQRCCKVSAAPRVSQPCSPAAGKFVKFHLLPETQFLLEMGTDKSFSAGVQQLTATSETDISLSPGNTFTRCFSLVNFPYNMEVFLFDSLFPLKDILSFLSPSHILW